MSDTSLTTTQSKPLTPAQSFGRTVAALAEQSLTEMFGSENGKAASARVALAFRAAASTARNPDDLYRCSPASVASCMALSAMTQIMPGGPNPGCYLIPKGGVLGWWITSRGIKTLARRAGQVVATFPYFTFDVCHVDEFEQTMSLTKGAGDRDDYSKLVGIVVLVRDLTTGAKLAMRDVTRAQIEKRRAKSLQPNAGPWKDWPMEMAEKTAVKFAASRGEIVFDDVGNTTYQRDAEVIEATATVHTEAPRQLTSTAALDEALGYQPTDEESERIAREEGGSK
jgi:recombinational DNA repair protein RecT